jgi:cysteinyl-tRNA synthetase
MRKAKQWQKADEIRAKLAEMGVFLEDTTTETKVIWKRKK